MSVQQEDVEKFLKENPAFAKKYFDKKMSPAFISKVSGLPAQQVDFSQFKELTQVKYITSLLVYQEREKARRDYRADIGIVKQPELPNINLSIYI